jgi:hypothetical protein
MKFVKILLDVLSMFLVSVIALVLVILFYWGILGWWIGSS